MATTDACALLRELLGGLDAAYKGVSASLRVAAALAETADLDGVEAGVLATYAAVADANHDGVARMAERVERLLASGNGQDGNADG